MIKRVFSFLLIVWMLASVCVFSEGNDPVFNELGNYLLYIDRLLEDEAFALKYVEKFYQTRTQDDLWMARTAINSALREIRSMEIPETSMTDDEYFSYMIAGAEVEALALLYENLEEMKNGKIYRLESVYRIMMADMYFEPALDNLMEKIRLYHLDNLYCARDLAYMTNYLLLQLKDGGNTEAFWETIQACTCVMKNEMDVFYTDPDQITALAGENLDQMDVNVGNLEVLGSFAEYFLELTAIAVENNDVSVFKNNRTEIIGETPVFPMPNWYFPAETKDSYVFTRPGTDKVYLHTMGSEIPSAPDSVKITLSGITIDEISEYVDSLMILEYNPYYEFETENGVTSLYVMAERDGSTLMIVWNEKETDLFLMNPAANLVPYLYWK